FAVPKVLQGEANSSTSQPYQQRVNTNLTEISDWLTKIIVGLGLIELRTMPDRLKKLAAYMAPSVAGSDAAGTIALAIIIFFTISGFLFGYLVTRLFLQQALSRADRAAAASDLASLRHQVEQVKGAAANAAHKAELGLAAAITPTDVEIESVDDLIKK